MSVKCWRDRSVEVAWTIEQMATKAKGRKAEQVGQLFFVDAGARA